MKSNKISMILATALLFASTLSLTTPVMAISDTAVATVKTTTVTSSVLSNAIEQAETALSKFAGVTELEAEKAYLEEWVADAKAVLTNGVENFGNTYLEALVDTLKDGAKILGFRYNSILMAKNAKAAKTTSETKTATVSSVAATANTAKATNTASQTTATTVAKAEETKSVAEGVTVKVTVMNPSEVAELGSKLAAATSTEEVELPKTGETDDIKNAASRISLLIGLSAAGVITATALVMLIIKNKR